MGGKGGTEDGEQITDHFDMAEECNHFFSSVMTHCSPLKLSAPDRSLLFGTLRLHRRK